MTKESDFFAYAKDLFGFTVDNVHPSPARKVKILRHEFWEEIYRQRDPDEENFNHFLTSTVDLLCLSGHVGTGKSTYLRHKFEHRQDAQGIIVDMQRHSHRFDGNAEPKKIFQAVLAEECHEVLRTMRMLEVHANCLFTRDCHHDAPLPVPHLPRTVAMDRVQKDAADADIAVAALMYLDSATVSRLRPVIRGMATTTEGQARAYREHLIESPGGVAGLIKALEWTDWVRLYEARFPDNTQTLILFDNVDALDLERIGPHLIEWAIELLNATARDSDVSAVVERNRGSLNAAIVIRDENISRLRVGTGATQRIMQIVLGPDDLRLEDSAHIASEYVDERALGEIVEKRLRKLEAKFPELPECRAFVGLVRTHWLVDEGQGRARIQPSTFDICRIGNYSIRLVLELIANGVSHILQAASARGIALESLRGDAMQLTLKGRLIRSLFERAEYRKTIELLADATRKESDTLEPNVARMLLTYLVQRKQEKGATPTVAQCAAALKRVFKVDEFVTKQVLCDLYLSDLRIGSAVTIDQLKIVKEAIDVDNNADVRPNARSVVLLDEVIINIDYFGSLNGHSTKVMMEMTPRDAVDYVSEILEAFVKPMVERHEQVWREFIVPAFPREGKVSTFERYRREYVYTHSLYAKRVCDSHRSVIKRYIAQALRGKDSPLLLTDAERDELVLVLDGKGCTVRQDGAGESRDEELAPIVSSMPVGNELRRLWEFYGEYGMLGERLAALMNE